MVDFLRSIFFAKHFTRHFRRSTLLEHYLRPVQHYLGERRAKTGQLLCSQ
jgi:hypothetical protein